MMLPIVRMARRAASALTLLLVVFALLPAAYAQETTAAVQGTVTDPTGAVVPGATIVATGSKLLSKVSTTSDSHGFYRLNALPPGTYTLTVTGAGMSAKATDLTLLAGDLPNLNIRLTAAGTEAVIDVSASVAIVDVTQSKVETTISNDILQEIPKGRSFQSVIPFAPGARQEPMQSDRNNRVGGFQIDGASNGENVYMSDGLNITSIIGGGVGANVPTEFVQDVQVKSSSFEAEFGGAMGGVVNVIQQKGTNNWHGSFFTYYRSSALNANDQCNFAGSATPFTGSSINLYSTTCGLRLDPATKPVAGTRTEQAAQFYIARQDHYRQLDPGFTIGGPLWKDKLGVFASYAPSFSRTRRNVTFTKTNPGTRDFYQSSDTHFALGRVDYSPFSKLNAFASWTNSYNRSVGVLPNPDSKIGQRNASATTDPTTIRADTGTTNPLTLYTFGANYTVTSNTLLSVRYGYFYSDTHDIGKPFGNRWVFNATSAPGTFTSTPIDSTSPYYQAAGYQNMGANQQMVYDVLTRKQLDVDVSTIKSGWAGTHNFKAGYAMYKTAENVLNGYKTAYTYFMPGSPYTPKSSTHACDQIIAQNKAAYPTADPKVINNCQGDYGYFVVQDGTDQVGNVSNTDHSIYFQDAWTVGHSGLTINAGVRFDKEYIPPYDPSDKVDVSFGFADKIAPRIGAAYDLLHNGKVKIYGSYGQFYDIMKASLARGSFGGDYWHDCVYAWDSPDYTLVTPTAPGGHACPSSGGAPGVPSSSTITAKSFRLIENQDWRAHTQDAADPQVDPHLKPMSEHEYIVGTDWAIQPTLSFSARYARKILDHAIEDISINDAVYYIGNPGPGYGDPLHRASDQMYQITGDPGYLNPAGACPTCPIQPKATRDYNGLELRVTKMGGTHFFVTAFYTYSKLTGNYPGLTSTFITDGGGGRSSPNNNRSFDLPQMQFTAHGKPFGGPLPTDRPNTFGAFGSYRLKWFGGESQLGFGQSIYQGSPVSTAWSTISGTSSVQFVEDQGNWVNLSRDSSGNFISNGITHDRRTPAYLQTDLNLTHYFHLSKDHETRKLGAEINVQNAFNQHAVTSYFETAVGNGNSAVAPTANNPTTFDYNKLMTNFDYIGETNKENLWVSNRYGMPQQFQLARQMRIKLAYIF